MLEPRSFPGHPSHALALGALVAGLATPLSVSAHGRFPGSGGVVFDANDPRHVVVRTTFGLYDNPDASRGPTEGWRWLCSAAIGYDANKEDPALTFAGDRLVAGTFAGLVVASPDRCSFAAVPELAGRYVVELAALPSADAPAKGSPVLALASNGVGEDLFDVKLFESVDGAASFRDVGADLPEDFLALSILGAPAKDDPLRWGAIYLSGRDGSLADGYHAVVMRSDDGGVTWIRHEVPGLDGLETLPYLQAARPGDPGTVFVGAVRDMAPARSQRNLVTRDGGETWSEYFAAEELLPAFAVSPDGTRVAFGGEKTGLMTGEVATLTEAGKATQVGKTRVSCLSWRSDALYACGNAFVDGFTVGRSEDGGKTFAPVSFLTSACDALECAPDTVVGATCPALWPTEALEIVAPLTCDPAAPPPAEEPGCDCTASRPAGDLDPAVGLAIVGLGLAVRRRRR